MRSWLGFLNQESPPTWVRASLPSEIWSWESSSEPRTRCWERGGCWGQGRETCYPFGVVDQLLLHPSFSHWSAPKFMGDTWGSWTLYEKQTWPDKQTWCTSSSGVAGKERKASGCGGELQKLATHLATPIQFGTLLFSPWYFQIFHGLRSRKSREVKLTFGIWF